MFSNYSNRLKIFIILLNICFYLTAYYLKGISVDGFIISIVFFVLLLASIEDIKTYKIANKYVITILVLGLISVIYKGEYINILSLIIVFLVFIISGFIGLKIGMGDIKLISVSTLLLGLKGVITAFIIGIFLSAVVGIVFIISKKMTFKSKLALAPYLTIGIIVALLFYK